MLFLFIFHLRSTPLSYSVNGLVFSTKLFFFLFLILFIIHFFLLFLFLISFFTLSSSPYIPSFPFSYSNESVNFFNLVKYFIIHLRFEFTSKFFKSVFVRTLIVFWLFIESVLIDDFWQYIENFFNKFWLFHLCFKCTKQLFESLFETQKVLVDF